MKAEISKKLNDCKRALESLRAERDTADKQAQYLLNLATQFQNLTDLAVKAHYGGNEVFDYEKNLRLATEIVSRNTKFSDDMGMYGHRYHFHDDGPKSPQDGTKGDNTENESSPVSTRYVQNPSDLEGVLPADGDFSAPSKVDILEWLKETYHKSRGFELGTFDPSILTEAMRQQSRNWNALSIGYASDAVALVHTFIAQMLQRLCSDERVCERLLSLLMDSLLEKYRKVLERVELLLRVELTGIPMTANHYFNENLQKR